MSEQNDFRTFCAEKLDWRQSLANSGIICDPDFASSSSAGTLKSTRTRRPFISKSRTDNFPITFPVQLRDVLEKIDATIGIAPLVVVPADQFEKAAIEFHAGARIKDTGTRVMQEIGRNRLVFGITKNPF